MGMCPLCNGFDSYTLSCKACGSILQDSGKVTDFLDDYSAYLDIDMLKMVDGDVQSLEDKTCLHVFSCPVCNTEQIIALKE